MSSVHIAPLYAVAIDWKFPNFSKIKSYLWNYSIVKSLPYVSENPQISPFRIYFKLNELCFFLSFTASQKMSLHIKTLCNIKWLRGITGPRIYLANSLQSQYPVIVIGLFIILKVTWYLAYSIIWLNYQGLLLKTVHFLHELICRLVFPYLFMFIF